MKMISPSNREVDVGKTLSETEYIGMCRREVLDAYLRDRAKSLGATVYNGLFMRMERVRLLATSVCSGVGYTYISYHNRLCVTNIRLTLLANGITGWQRFRGHGHR